MLFRAFRSVQPALEGNRPFSKPRHEVIHNTPAPRERELAKMDALGDALALQLKLRGIAEIPADLAGRIGMAAFVNATVSWLDEPETGLGERLDIALAELKALLTGIDS